MTQLNDEHFEVMEKNKIERYERQKLTYLEDRIKVLEKSIEAIHKVLGRYDMTKGNNSWNIVKDRVAILTIQQIESVDQKETSATKLEV